MIEHSSYNALATLYSGSYEKLRSLRERYVSWAHIWEELENKERAAVSPEGLWKKLSENDTRLILFEDAEYPPLLKEIPLPPFGIYVKGVLPAGAPFVAIVGTRKATPQGKELAQSFAADLASCGVVIVSGCAFGIDAAAHRGALDARGQTIAVFASGLDTIYPKSNTRLAAEILENNGAYISEYPIGIPPLQYRFLERNRIVSGLSRGVIVIEAPRRSGSLATARFALEQNRDVFVVPGGARHPHYQGSHELIKDGATLVTDADDILRELNIAPSQPSVDIPLLDANDERVILEAIERAQSPLVIDKIVEITNLRAKTVHRHVSLMLISKKIKETRNGYILS